MWQKDNHILNLWNLGMELCFLFSTASRYLSYIKIRIKNFPPVQKYLMFQSYKNLP